MPSLQGAYRPSTGISCGADAPCNALSDFDFHRVGHSMTPIALVVEVGVPFFVAQLLKKLVRFFSVRLDTLLTMHVITQRRPHNSCSHIGLCQSPVRAKRAWGDAGVLP